MFRPLRALPLLVAVSALSLVALSCRDAAWIMEPFVPADTLGAAPPALDLGAVCPEQPLLVRPECSSSWKGYGTDNTEAIREAIVRIKAAIDSTNCDIRTTPARSPFNRQEPWCGSVVLHAGANYSLAQIGSLHALPLTWMQDWDGRFSYGEAGRADGLDPVFGITLEADDPSLVRPMLILADGAIFGLGPYDRIRHVHVRGPFYDKPLPWCTGKTGECGKDLANGVYGSSDLQQGLNVGWMIDDVVIEGFQAYGVMAAYSRNATIRNSVIRHNGNGGLLAAGGPGLRVTNNDIYENGTNGVDLGDSGGGALIENNRVWDNGWREWGGENNGILVLQTSENTVTGNHVFNTKTGRQDRGINVYEGNVRTENNIVTNNTVEGHRDFGINVGFCTAQQGCKPTGRTLVEGNILRGNGGTSPQIGFVGTVNDITVRGNTIFRPGPCVGKPAGGQDVQILQNTCK